MSVAFAVWEKIFPMTRLLHASPKQAGLPSKEFSTSDKIKRIKSFNHGEKFKNEGFFEF